VEARLVDALAQYDRVEPSVDLFQRIDRSLAEDRAHRQRVLRWTLGSAAGLVATSLAIVSISFVSPSGRLIAPAWGVRVIELAILGALTVALGPAIRRFGSIYVAGVFRLSPETGSRFLALIDVAYYLVFSGYAVAGVVLRSAGRNLPLASLLQTTAYRIGGLLLLMGLLHAVTIAVLPVIGLLHASIVRRHRRTGMGSNAPPPSPRAEQAERVVRIMLWAAITLVVVQVLVGLGVVLGIAIAG
jgi:hypothetical protein